MKGIILAGGIGSRLYPLTKGTSKQFLPIYDKPMIYYPLATLMQFGIKDILIVSSPHDKVDMKRLLGDGSVLGLNIKYAIQKEPKGSADAFAVGAKFVGNSGVCLIFCDNIFYIKNQFDLFKQKIKDVQGEYATIFVRRVSDPRRFGVVEFDKNLKVVSIKEKPKYPKSNFISVGLYFYPPDAMDKIKTLKPSARGEIELTDLNNIYLKENRLGVAFMRHGDMWFDAGTPESLLFAGQFIRKIEKLKGLKIACIEEIAYKQGIIDDKQLLKIINKLKNCDYKT